MHWVVAGYRETPEVEVPPDLVTHGAMMRYALTGFPDDPWWMVISGPGTSYRSWVETDKPSFASAWHKSGFWVTGTWMSVGNLIKHHVLVSGLTFATSEGDLKISRQRRRFGFYDRSLDISLGEQSWRLSRRFPLHAVLRRGDGSAVARFGWFRWLYSSDLSVVEQAVVAVVVAMCAPAQVGGPLARFINHEVPRRWPRRM